MPILSNISFRRAIGILVAVLAILAGGTWITVKVTTDHLLDTDATTNARDWAKFIAANVTDLEQIANGEQPSSASLAFFVATRKAGQVYRYLIFNREGYSQLVSDHDQIAPVDLSEFNASSGTRRSAWPARRRISRRAPVRRNLCILPKPMCRLWSPVVRLRSLPLLSTKRSNAPISSTTSWSQRYHSAC